MTTRVTDVRLTSTLVLILSMTAILGGCSIVPYEERFACEGRDDYGRCTSVDGAYHQAVTGEPQGPKITRERDASSGAEDDFGAVPDEGSGKGGGDPKYGAYKKALYRKLQRMIEEPVTPMVKPPHVVRALMLTYKTAGRGTPLFMPRYVYFFADEPTWVLGQQETRSADSVMPLVKKELTP